MSELTGLGGIESPEATMSPFNPQEPSPPVDLPVTPAFKDEVGLLTPFASTQVKPALPTPEAPGRDFGSSFGTGLEDFSAGMSVYNALGELGAIKTNSIDPDYVANRDSLIKEDQELSGRFAAIEKAAKFDHGAAELLNGYYSATNMDVARDILVRQWDHLQDIQRRAKEDGGLGYWLGAAAGLGLDLAVLAPLTGGAGVVATGTRGLSLMQRGAAIAATDATIDSIARNEWDKSFTFNDAMLSIGLSSVVGGALGKTVDLYKGRQVNRATLERGLADALDKMEADALAKTGDSAGAARADEFAEPLDAVSTNEVANLDAFGSDNIAVRVFTSPKQKAKALIDTVVDPLANTGKTVAARVMNRVYSLTGQTDQYARGIKSSQTMEDGMRLMRDELRAHRVQIEDLDKKLVRDLYGKGSLARLMKMGVPDRNVRRSQADQLMVSRANLSKAQDDMVKLEDKIKEASKPPKEGADPKAAKRKLKYLESKRAGIAKRVERAERGVKETTEKVRAQARDDGIDADAYLRGIEGIGTLDNDYFLKVGQRAQAVGLLPKNQEIRPGYRMQSWNPEAIKAYETEFRGLLYTTLFDSPQPEFIAKYTKDADNLDDVFAMDPALAEKIQQEWSDAVIELAEEEAGILMRAAEWKYSSAFDDAFHELMADHYTRAQRYLEDAEALHAELDEIRWTVNGPDYKSPEVTARVNRLVFAINRKEHAASLRMQKHDHMKTLLGQSIEMEDFIRSNLKDARGAGIKVSNIDRNLKTAGTKAGKRVEEAVAKNDVRKIVDDIVESVVGQRSVNPFEAEDFVQTSKHFKARGLDLTGFHHMDSVQKLMNQGSDDMLHGYAESVGIQVQLEDKFGALMRAEGKLKEGDHHVADALVRYVDDAFAAELKLLKPDSPEHLKLLKERKRTMALVEGSLQEFTRADRARQLSTEVGAGVDRGVGMVSTLLSMTLLNRAVLSALGDLQSMASGSGRFVMPIVPMMKQMGRVFGSDLKDADLAQWVAVRGSSVLDQAEFGNRFDPDMTPHYAGAGTHLRSMQLKLEDANVYAQWANMSTPWTLFVRKVVGTEAAGFIRKDAAKGWDSLSDGVRVAYANAGIDKADLMAIHALTKEFGTIKDGLTKFANTSKWDTKYVVKQADGSLKVVDAKGPLPTQAIHGRTIRETYMNGINRLAAQMHLDPAIGDRPFWFRHPLGRLFSAFQSFTYAAAERFVWPMVQDLRMNHIQSRYLYAMMMGIGLSSINLGARDVLDGKDSATLRMLRGEADAEDTWAALQSAIRRSPLMVGQLAQMMEAAQNIGGRTINDLADFPVFPEESVRFRHGQGLVGTLGPLPGTMARVGNIATKFADGQYEEGLTGMSKMTPLIGTIYGQLLLQRMMN